MNRDEAKQSIKAVNAELFSLVPSTLITMFEIDTTNLAFDIGLISSTSDPESPTVFRFHNTINFTKKSIIWQGFNYIAAPIHAEGFDINSRGTLPTPTLSINVDDQYTALLNPLRYQIKLLNNLVGAKVTRIRTFAKYLDAINFYGISVPSDFIPDTNAELPRDVYYIDRKSNENKFGIEFQLGSILDVEGIQLPLRLVIRNRCVWHYRGNGCSYEYAARKTAEHGDANLPTAAPPVANYKNERIRDLLEGAQIIDRGKWHKDATYKKGESVFIEKNEIKYYFVCKIDNPSVGPPNLQFWIPDQCAKDITACKFRWSDAGNDVLRFGGFPAVNRAL